jgi:hypothetical protein
MHPSIASSNAMTTMLKTYFDCWNQLLKQSPQNLGLAESTQQNLRIELVHIERALRKLGATTADTRLK